MWNHVMGDRSTRVTPRSSPAIWAASGLRSQGRQGNSWRTCVTEVISHARLVRRIAAVRALIVGQIAQMFDPDGTDPGRSNGCTSSPVKVCKAAHLPTMESPSMTNKFADALKAASTIKGCGCLKHVGGYFDPVVSKRSCRLAFQEDTTVQELLAEAWELLFRTQQITLRKDDQLTVSRTQPLIQDQLLAGRHGGHATRSSGLDRVTRCHHPGNE